MTQGSRAQRIRREFMTQLPRLGVTSARQTAGEARILDLPRMRYQRLSLDNPDHDGSRVALYLRISVHELADLVQLATSGVLRGEIFALSVRVANVPAWLLAGLRPRLRRAAWRMIWRRSRSGLRMRIYWTRPQLVGAALQDVLTAITRAKSWDQTSGPMLRLDRAAWLDGGATWPQGRLAVSAEVHDNAFQESTPAGPGLPSIFTTMTNPIGRRLLGTATSYRASWHSDRMLLRDNQGRVAGAVGATVGQPGAALDRYSAIVVDGIAPDHGSIHAMRMLAACGAVFAASAPALRAELESLGLTSVADPAEIADLRGYTLSVAAARGMAIMADPAIRRTALNPDGDGALPLPTISVVLSSMRADRVTQALSYLGNQDYPAYEVLLGLHGYDVPTETKESWQALLTVPLRITAFAAETPFGAVLGALSRWADGELITKVDDDDHYGLHHLTDLFLALHATGADLVAKGARFVYLQGQDQTIDRVWAVPETFDVTVAGGTLLLPRSTLSEAGGWSHAPRHVDADLITRIRAAGGVTYRTHCMEYVYVRQPKGHTWQADLNELVEQGGQTYAGLPSEIMHAYKDEYSAK